jgi:glucose/arabinose dehydrogenase
MRRAVALLSVVAAATLAGCTALASPPPPDWRPSPNNPAIEGPGAARIQPILPIPSGRRGSGTPNAGPGANGSQPSAGRRVGDPFVVAKHLRAPVGLALLPDNTALVGERTSGRIVRVQPRPGQPVPVVRTLTGLDTSGDGGLLDLAVSPTYDEDHLVYAYITTRTDNRVVEFTLHGPVTPIFTGIPKGPFDNTGRLLFAPDGTLYIGTGDAGRSRQAQRMSSLAGKVLHVTDIGQPARDNPRRRSPVWTSGHRVVDGLCAAQAGTVWEAEAGGPGQPDEVNLISRGDYYGWPTPRGTEHDPVADLPAKYSSPGGCAVLFNRLWVTSLDGTALLSAPIRTVSGPPLLGAFRPILRNRYGRLRTVVAAPDGALWLTTSNRDGRGDPVRADERVIRYVPNSNDLGGSRA